MKPTLAKFSIVDSEGRRFATATIEPAPPPLMLIHRAEPAYEPGTGECALSQSCGGSALKLSAFAVQEQVVEMRGGLRCAHIKFHLYTCLTDG